jgi:transcriptional regulator with XRE-family HTH domain
MTEEQTIMKLKEVLRSLLKKNDLNVAQLARAVKLSEKTIHNWLAGQHPRNLDHLQKVAEHFKVSIDFLCGYSDPSASIKDPLSHYMEDEIYAGKFEVILRKIGNNKG